MSLEHLPGAKLQHPLLDKAEWAFSRKQRISILERDEFKCQATVPHQHDKKHPLEVDHIIPQRYAKAIGLPNVDIPENALSKCRNAHDLKHKDRISARDKWRESHNGSFKRMFEDREKLLDQGVIYWDPSYDRQDMVQALKRTQIAQKKGWVFPEAKHRKKRRNGKNNGI